MLYTCECRRRLLALSLGFCAWDRIAAADQAEDSLYSLGEINGVLNACPLNSLSCASTQNDDEAHFIPPWQVLSTRCPMYQILTLPAVPVYMYRDDLIQWAFCLQYDGDLQTAKQRLLQVATGAPPSFSVVRD